MRDRGELETVLRYHERTKHRFDRYARGPGALDWANQPDPFRRYAGAPLVHLPRLGPEEGPLSPAYEHLHRPAAVPGAPLTLRTLSRLFEYALALSAWKQAAGTRWALRINPSSGNLHPTEGYLLIGALPGLAESPGLYHYAPREHALERRADCPADWFARLTREFPAQAFLVGLSSVHWREAWKYGERAFRYCQHDAGHAIGTLRIAAATLGWSAVVLHGLADETVEQLLGLDRVGDFVDAEREHPDLVMLVWPAKAVADRHEPAPPADGPPTGRIIHQRRSLLACDGRTSIAAERFYRLLTRVMPRRELEVLRRPMPWDALPWEPSVHFGLFVHRVTGLDPGLYALARDLAKVEILKRAMHERFVWTAPPACPANLPFYLLEAGDARQLAAQVSCHQAIAGDGAFCLGMFAEYQQALITHGPWFYRRLYWEAGLIGQVLYLEAEAAGVRATGIGCYFDDPVHQVFGFKGLAFQSLYHFTVGGAVDDPRLTTLPPYGAQAGGPQRGMDLP
ncbi:MAG: SagB family peptide dehydrogenase [Burkholderiales bacterium]